jgi:hypothetical protein
MPKFCIGLLVAVCCTALSCNQPAKQSKSSEAIPKNDLQSEVDEYKKSIPETNKDSGTDEWNDNVYRNKVYKFRVEFPKNWEFDKGTAKHTVARAINRNYVAVIAVTIMHLPDQPKNPNNIIESTSAAEYKAEFNKLLALQNTKAENLNIKEGSLNNFPAYIIDFTHKASSGTQTEIFKTIQIQSYYNSIIYQVTLNIPTDKFDSEINLIFNRVLNSFNFELAY